MEQFETVFFGREPIEGVSVLLGGLTDNPIIEHGYWGSMRDRMPLSQTDTIDPSGKLTIKQGSPEKGGRVIVAGHQNLTLIRSGEDWSRTADEERRTWFDDIQPVLLEGMNFLRDDGLEVGCYVNRYCYHVDENGKPEERGFGVSLWHSMQNLESWAELSLPHLQIFVTFHRLAKKFSNLTLYHEVSVFDLECAVLRIHKLRSEDGRFKSCVKISSKDIGGAESLDWLPTTVGRRRPRHHKPARWHSSHLPPQAAT